MFPMKTEEEIKALVNTARSTDNKCILLSILPIWMGMKIERKRRLSEDDKAELVLTILEKFDVMWRMSLKYDINVVLGFFVTYAFNLFRNQNRKVIEFDERVNFLELWQESKFEPDASYLLNPKVSDQVELHLDSMPIKTGLVVCLKFDFPILGKHRKALEWSLNHLGQKFADFEHIYDKKKEKGNKKIELCTSRILRYTRLLMEASQNEKRSWYLRKKKEWVLAREKAVNKSFFSEREVARLLGMSRKEVRVHLSNAKRRLKMHKKDLLHCA